jgi:hypothetical protein
MNSSLKNFRVKIIDIQKNNFAALSVGNGLEMPIPILLPCEMNFLKVCRNRESGGGINTE